MLSCFSKTSTQHWPCQHVLLPQPALHGRLALALTQQLCMVQLVDQHAKHSSWLSQNNGHGTSVV